MSAIRVTEAPLLVGTDRPLLSVETAASVLGEQVTRPPVRLVHLGLGAFHRSHQLWHTAVADEAGEWGYASFTGRSPSAARTLDAQDGLYTIATRGPEGDRLDLVSSLAEVHDGADVHRLAELLRSPAVAVVTLTITEAGYRLGAGGDLDPEDPDTAADLGALALTEAAAGGAAPPLRTALGRLVFALAARRDAEAGPVTILPCDNMPQNGAVVARAVGVLAEAVSPGLARWVRENVAFASSVVDRITPATTEDDIRSLAERIGVTDRGLVVTEPFSEWIIAGEFPAGRPEWERSGARIVADVEPYERRKLWMLNGAHTVLAITARGLGHTTVSDAIADPSVRAWVEEYWDVAAERLAAPELAIGPYRDALVERFSNARIAHHLDQIAAETTTKLRYRIVPLLVRARSDGRLPTGCVRPIAAWVWSLRAGRRDSDTLAPHIDAALAAPPSDVTASLLGILDPAFRTDAALIAEVDAYVALPTPA